jgi:Tol biopolymer transport system component
MINSRFRRLGTLVGTICILLGLLVAPTSEAAGEPRRLSDPAVISMRFTPDSRRVVYIANNTLYSISTAGGQATKLNGPLADHFRFEQFDFQISPDGSRVVYIAKQSGDIGMTLYSVPVTGGTSVRLKPASANTEDIGQYQFSPDGRSIVFRTFHQGYPPQSGELFMAPIDGSSPAIKLHGPLSSSQTVQWFEISPDNSHVVYRIDELLNDSGSNTLYSVPIGGGGSTLLATTAPDQIAPYLISSDSSRVVYADYSQKLGGEALFSVAITGGAAIELDGPADVSFTRFELTKHHRALFWAQSNPEAGLSLYSVPIDGSGPALPLIDAASVHARYATISPDGSYVIYLAQKDGTPTLFRVPTDGGSPIPLSSPADSKGVATEEYIGISPDSQRVLYLGDAQTSQLQLFSVPIDGSADPVQISDPAQHNGTIVRSDLSFTPNSQHLLYRVQDASTGNFSLFSAPIDGSSSLKKLSAGITSLRISPDNFVYNISPDSRQVIFRGGDQPEGPHTLYISELIDYRFTIFVPNLTR